MPIVYVPQCHIYTVHETVSKGLLEPMLTAEGLLSNMSDLHLWLKGLVQVCFLHFQAPVTASGSPSDCHSAAAWRHTCPIPASALLSVVQSWLKMS